MFIILITYKKSANFIDAHLNEHLAFLDIGYVNNFFVVSGRKNPRTGGVIISQLKDRQELQLIIEQDPFYKFDLADYELIEFIPSKFKSEFSLFI